MRFFRWNEIVFGYWLWSWNLLQQSKGRRLEAGFIQLVFFYIFEILCIDLEAVDCVFGLVHLFWSTHAKFLLFLRLWSHLIVMALSCFNLLVMRIWTVQFTYYWGDHDLELVKLENFESGNTEEIIA